MSGTTALEIAEGLPRPALLALLSIQKGLTMAQAMRATINQEVARSQGQATLHKLICAVLKLFCTSINVSQSMSATQVYEAAGFWLENYPTESPKDLILCLKMAKQGKFGKIYNRFDGEVLGEFWQQYLELKVEYLENRWLDTKAAEASNEKAMLQQIEQHLPGTLTAFKITLPSTPEVVPFSHSRYLIELSERLPFASADEMADLRKQAQSVGMNDVIELIDQELISRAQ